MALTVYGKTVEVTVAESLATAKSFHTDVWSRLLRAESGERSGDGELFVMVRWAGVNPLFESPWGVSEVPITALTSDLKAVARAMERDRYPEPARPRPMRVSGRVHARENGGEEALGSVWTGEPDSAYGARASRRV